MKTSQVIIGLAAAIGVILIGWYLYMQQTPTYKRTFTRGIQMGADQAGTKPAIAATGSATAAPTGATGAAPTGVTGAAPTGATGVAPTAAAPAGATGTVTPKAPTGATGAVEKKPDAKKPEAK